MKIGEGVPKRRHIKLRGKGITQKKEYNNTPYYFVHIKHHKERPRFEYGPPRWVALVMVRTKTIRRVAIRLAVRLNPLAYTLTERSYEVHSTDHQ